MTKNGKLEIQRQSDAIQDGLAALGCLTQIIQGIADHLLREAAAMDARSLRKLPMVLHTPVLQAAFYANLVLSCYQEVARELERKNLNGAEVDALYLLQRTQLVLMSAIRIYWRGEDEIQNHPELVAGLFWGTMAKPSRLAEATILSVVEFICEGLLDYMDEPWFKQATASPENDAPRNLEETLREVLTSSGSGSRE